MNCIDALASYSPEREPRRKVRIDKRSGIHVHVRAMDSNAIIFSTELTKGWRDRVDEHCRRKRLDLDCSV